MYLREKVYCVVDIMSVVEFFEMLLGRIVVIVFFFKNKK